MQIELGLVGAAVGAGLATLTRGITTPPEPGIAELPSVVVQIPVRGELGVLRRVVDAALGLDWPALQVQVLDDSDAEQHAAVDTILAGCPVQILRRPIRDAGKAGNLAAGLAHTQAPFVAVFDADHVPAPDFLRRTVPWLVAHPELAFVQGRLDGHNRDDSALTAAQGLAFDLLMGVEQARRSARGEPFAFNGAAGVWRRAAIDDAGGWVGGFAEDLDLSARVARRGWRGKHLPAVRVMSDLPASMLDFVHQQLRWTHGKATVLRRLGVGPLLRPALARLVWPALVVAAALVCTSAQAPAWAMAALAAVPGASWLLWRATARWDRVLVGLPAAIALAVALAPRGAWAFGLGLLGVRRPHVVAAKGGLPAVALLPFPELAWALVLAAGAAWTMRYGTVPGAIGLGLLAAGPAWVGLSLAMDLRARSSQPAVATVPASRPANAP